MKVTCLVQHPKVLAQNSVVSQIASWPTMGNCHELRVAVAYATVSGIRTFLSALSKSEIANSYWLVGLDDAISQPGALDLILKLDGAQLRVASYQSNARRFHPKVFQFRFPLKADHTVSLVGSANLTSTALTQNGEAVVFLERETDADEGAHERLWNDLWNQGHVPQQPELDRYRLLYKTAKKKRADLEKTLRAPDPTAAAKLEILSSDVAELDPTLAQTCWIECGNITAMGRELEFKAEQGMFFGLKPTGEPPRVFQFRTSNGGIVPLRMKYQGNSMWRLQMNNDVPEVRIGLRPRLPDNSLGRSPYVAVFKRGAAPQTFGLSFVRIGSREFREILAKSREKGTVGRTSARQYGWY